MKWEFQLTGDFADLQMLSQSFNCSALSAQAQGQQGQQTPLPDGKAKEMVQAMCTRGPGLNLITNSGGHLR
jgi:hypothetical protein